VNLLFVAGQLWRGTREGYSVRQQIQTCQSLEDRD
jgi:hypothetical protein